MTQVGTETFDYDANGNMVKDVSRTMSYGATNQLTQVKMANGYSKAAGRYFSKGGSMLSKSRGGFVRTEVGIMGQFVEHFIGVDIDLGLKASWELLGGEK